MQESSLHNSLKRYYAQPEDLTETPLEGYVIDILHGSECIEIQTGNFPALKPKLAALLPNHSVRVVYPISQQRWIEKKYPDDPNHTRRRRSPKKRTFYELANELVYITPYLSHSNFKCEIVFISEVEVQYPDGHGSWRRKGWSIIDHRLEQVFSVMSFTCPQDYSVLLPETLSTPFTSRDLSQTAGISPRLAGKTCYLLRELGIIEVIGKQKRFQLFRKLN